LSNLSRLISEDYAKQNEELHKNVDYYGTSGKDYVRHVVNLIERFNCGSVLDYGAGKCTLDQALKHQYAGVPLFKVVNYEPAFKHLQSKEPCDFVSCTDVLEHVEPGKLDAVLDDIRDNMNIAGFLTVCTLDAKKRLPDGRNAHLIVKDYRWWAQKIWSRFDIIKMELVSGDVYFSVGKNLQFTGHKKPVAFTQPDSQVFA
jgi:hypothetical protein